MIRKIARFSRISLAVFAITGLVALTVVALFGEKVLRSQVETRLSGALHRRVTLGGLSVNLAGRVVELRDLVIPGLPASKEPSFSAPRVRIALSFRSLFTSRILLRGLEIEEPRISLQVFPDGSTDLPGMDSSGGPPSREVSIGKLVVHRGELKLNDEKMPLDLDWPNFEASLLAESRSLLKGDIAAGPGPMRFGDLPSQDTRFDLGIRFADSTLFIERGSFSGAGGTTLALSGSLDFHKGPKGEIRFSGPFDLETFDQRVVVAGLELKGLAQTQGILSIDGGKVALAGSLKGQHGSYDSIPIDAFASNLEWDGSDLRLKDLVVEGLGGKASLDLAVPHEAPTKVTGTLESLRAEPVLHWLFDYSSAGLGARVSGPIDLTLPPGAANLLSGSGDLQFTAEPEQGDPVSGRFPFTAEKGVITVTAARFEAPKTTLSASGVIRPDRRIDLEVSLLSQDLAVSDGLGVRLRTAFGAEGAQILGATGNGTVQGRATGTMDEPVFTGRFSGTSVAYLGVSWGAIDWAGSVSVEDLKSDRLTAARGVSRLEMSGAMRLGERGVDDAMDLRIAIRDWPARDLLRVAESDLDVDAAASGTVRLLGTGARPLGEATLTSGGGKAYGLPFLRGDLRLQFQGEALQVERLKASVGGGDLFVRGRLTGEGPAAAFDGEVEAKDLELADLGLQDPTRPMVGGRVSGRATLNGPIERPRVSAHLESKRFFYGDEGMGTVALDVTGTGNGVLLVTGVSDSPRFRADVTGSVEAKPPYQSRLEVKLTNARVDPVLRALGSRFENAVVITSSANARIDGPLRDPASITAQIRDGRLRIAVPEYAIEAAPGSVIDVEKGEVRIAGLTLAGEGTSVSVSGKLALQPDEANDLTVTGRTDLRVFSGFLKEWRLRGSATLRSQLAGTRNAVRLSGGLDIEDGAVRVRAFPQGLDGLNGRIVFSETQAKVAGLEGRFGGGRVSLSGQMGFGGAFPASFDFFLNGDSLGLRYPEGLRSTFGAALRLQGTVDSYWLTGNLLVSKALWTRKYTIASELLGGSGPAGGFTPASSGLKRSPMHLDIAIKAPGTLRLDNNLASLVAKADLTLTGSPTEPQLLGRVELERGKVYFRGNTYEVRRGVANFSNPREINPVFDIEADTRVKSYRLILLASGTVDRVSTRITSDPPLTSTQIASLLTTGEERNATSAGAATVGVGAVSSFIDEAAGKVAQELGIGLSRLSINAPMLGTGTRLTVGKRVTRDLEVVYSGYVGGGPEKLVTMEYTFSDRFSLVASWQEPGGYGADARARFVLGKKK
ncbi:MAG: translocation/assembly module TamB domain-containing protein [Vicinamibacteria bacterium]|nr:translocation/assembly module TamB domain-containing protein [Vicinamibacteria bacterium]